MWPRHPGVGSEWPSRGGGRSLHLMSWTLTRRMLLLGTMAIRPSRLRPPGMAISRMVSPQEMLRFNQLCQRSEVALLSTTSGQAVHHPARVVTSSRGAPLRGKAPMSLAGQRCRRAPTYPQPSTQSLRALCFRGMIEPNSPPKTLTMTWHQAGEAISLMQRTRVVLHLKARVFPDRD
jgi:hypothetical protein